MIKRTEGTVLVSSFKVVFDPRQLILAVGKDTQMIVDENQLTAVEGGDVMQSHRTEARIPVSPSSPGTVYALVAPPSDTARPWRQFHVSVAALPCLA